MAIDPRIILQGEQDTPAFDPRTMVSDILNNQRQNRNDAAANNSRAIIDSGNIIANETAQLALDHAKDVQHGDEVLGKIVSGQMADKYQPQKDPVTGATPQVIPGTEGLQVRSNWWVDDTGQPVSLFDGPAYKPDGSINEYSKKSILANAKIMESQGVNPGYINNYLKASNAAAVEHNKFALDAMGKQYEIQTKQEDLQKKVQDRMANEAFNIKTPEDMNRYFLVHPSAKQAFGLTPEMPPEQQFARIQEMGSMSDNAKQAAEVAAKAAESVDRKARLQLDRDKAAQEGKVVQTVVGEDGKPKVVVIDKKTGTSVDTGLQGEAPAGSTGSATTKRMVTKVINDGLGGARTLTSISKLGSSGGLFGGTGSTHGPGLIGHAFGGMVGSTVEGSVKNILTSDKQKLYNTSMAGLAVYIANAENIGNVPSEAQINQIEKSLTINPSDSEQVAQYKVAHAAAMLRDAVNSSKGIAQPEQMTQLEKIEEMLSPFPEPDYILAAKPGDSLFPDKEKLRGGNDGKGGDSKPRPELSSIAGFGGKK